MRQLLKIRVGSHAYSTNIETSDEDFQEVHVCSLDELYGFNYRDEIQFTKDHKSFEIKKFLELLVKANPNTLELLFAAKENILFKDRLVDELFENKQMFVTKQCFKSFGNYAITQIKKATALDKKANWEKDRIQRKTVLDFCYVLMKNESSIKFKKWVDDDLCDKTKFGFLANSVKIIEPNIGLTKVNNFKDIYSMYYMPVYGGFTSENSNEVQLRSIPKGSVHLGYLRFDKDSYSNHCRDYRSYRDWLITRNTDRYSWDKTEQTYDLKNMLHCRRLLNVALEIGETGTFSVFRPEHKSLIDIRMGNVDVKELISKIEEDKTKLLKMFENSSLPESVDVDWVEKYLIKIRRS